MTSLATRETVEAARLASRRRGVLSGSELGRVFAWLRPNDLVWSYWVNNYLLGNDPPAFDTLFWNNDTTNLSAALHSDYLDLYLGTPLPRGGAKSVLGTPIDLGKVVCDSFIVAGVTDHITPWHACYAPPQILGGRREFILSSSGHIQSVVNPPGTKRAAFFRNSDLPPTPKPGSRPPRSRRVRGGRLGVTGSPSDPERSGLHRHRWEVKAIRREQRRPEITFSSTADIVETIDPESKRRRQTMCSLASFALWRQRKRSGTAGADRPAVH